MTAWIMGHCQRDKLRPGGFGDLIYQAADAGEITLDEAPLLVRSFLSAGVDTTVNGIGNALLCLARHPDAYARLRADLSLARPAFEEALRYESTVQTFFRTTVREVAFAGATIPPDSKVLAFLAAANRDPRQWPEPDRYDITRRPSGHMAFGSGIHGCVGQVVARLEGELILTEIAKRVARIELAGEPTRRLNNTLRALGSSAGYIHRVILAQAVLCAAAGSAFGALVGLLVVAFSAETAMPVVLTPSLSLLILAITLLMCCGGAVSAVLKIMRLDPASVFTR